MESEGGWTSPSDLAEYAYCPRSHWYHHHPPSKGSTSHSSERRRAGERYHRSVLTAERHRAERGARYWLGVLTGVALVALGVAWLVRF